MLQHLLVKGYTSMNLRLCWQASALIFDKQWNITCSWGWRKYEVLHFPSFFKENPLSSVNTTKKIASEIENSILNELIRLSWAIPLFRIREEHLESRYWDDLRITLAAQRNYCPCFSILGTTTHVYTSCRQLRTKLSALMLGSLDSTSLLKF